MKLKIKRKKAALIAGSAVVVVVVLAGLGFFVKERSGLPKVDHLQEARNYSAKSNLASSEKEYLEAIKQDGGNVVLWRELAYVYQQEKKRPESISAYEKALTLGGDEATTENILANVYRDNGQTDKAISAYQKAIALNPNLVPAIVNLANLYVIGGRNTEAIALLLKYYDGTKAKSELGLQLIAVYRNAGNTKDANSTLAQVLNSDPTNAKALAIKKTL